MPTSKAVGVKKYGPMKKKRGQKGRAMEVEMRQFGLGKLHSGSKAGPKVKNRKQAIAIGLSEERKAEGKSAKKPSAKKKAEGHKKAEKAMNKAAHRRKRNAGRS